MERIAGLLTEYIIKKGMINEEDYDLYLFGFLSALEMGFSLIICLLLAIMFHMLFEGILFFVIFIPLRSYAGGLHLDKYWSCFILSCLTFCAILFLVKIVVVPWYILVVTLAFLETIVYLLYPVENFNRHVDVIENRYFKKKLMKYMAFDMLLAIFCTYLKKEKYLLLITGVFFMMVVTMILGKCKICIKNKEN